MGERVRIHFTLSDLARTRLATRPSLLAVTTLSTFRLAERAGGRGLEGWRRLVRARLGGTGEAAGRGRPGPYFAELAPTGPGQPVPRFLRPHVGLETLDEELERLLSTPRKELREDLEYVGRHRALPGWTRDLAAGDTGTAEGLARTVRDYHRVAVAPYWRGLASVLAADRAVRARQLAEGGVERVLDSLGPHIRWRPPVLEVRTSARVQYDYRLGGRGLVLAPGGFSSYVPCDPADGQPTLYYEVGPGEAFPAGCGGPFEGLAALLGHSRAAVLEVIAEGVTTGQLARRAGLSPASASEHASVLRGAGLVATRRSGRSSHHTLTDLGFELLYAAGQRRGRPGPLRQPG
jgi:DNA-binding transcriptional ArsR family regulator